MLPQAPLPAVAGRRFVRFECTERPAGLAAAAPGDALMAAGHRVAEVRTLAGAPVGVRPGDWLWRLEAAVPVTRTPGAPGWEGVTQHLQYTSGDQRTTLSQVSAAPRLPLAVLIPITKTPAWWDLAQDERQAHFRGSPSSVGHTAIGLRHADRIFRRLYHGRYLPGSEWDFLTYFEFHEEDRPAFLELVAALRDSPEWTYVARESEIWLVR